jgi:hypothetical protein
MKYSHGAQNGYWKSQRKWLESIIIHFESDLLEALAETSVHFIELQQNFNNWKVQLVTYLEYAFQSEHEMLIHPKPSNALNVIILKHLEDTTDGNMCFQGVQSVRHTKCMTLKAAAWMMRPKTTK